MSKFGERIRELRKQHSISQRDFADMVEVDFTYISKIETGDTPPPSRVTIRHIAQVLHADEQELLILADKVPCEIYRNLLQRPYRLLDDLYYPGRYDVQKWIDEASPLIEKEERA